MRRWLRRLVLAIILVPLALALSGYLWLRSSLPTTTGTIAVPGLHAAVAVTRDAAGVPTIRAADDHDAAFAMGYLHAQERLFQMDLQRRYAAGRLSEILGTRAVAVDRSMRTLGLYRAAERAYERLDGPPREALDAYAAGVNAYIDGRRLALPVEYYVLRASPERWRPADTIAWGKMMALQLSGNYRFELLRARMLQHVSAEQLRQLYPDYPKNAPVALGDFAALYRGEGDGGGGDGGLPSLIDRLYASLPDKAGPIRASNNWVVDGAHSASGKPIVANDPHLGFAAPGNWYLARIETPTMRVAGGTAPGAPFIIIGHNDRVAWGFTTTNSDVEDLFVERLDPNDPSRYLTPEGSRPFTVRPEQILVRGAEPVTIAVRTTRHGPVISDGAVAGVVAPAGHVIALQATFLDEDDPEDRTAQAFWELDHADGAAAVERAFRHYLAPQQNMVYADVDGTIGFLAAAKIPIRRKGDGWLPVPGWTGEYDWVGYVPFEELPRAVNPPAGRVVTANNKIVPDSYPHFIGRDWDIPNRAERIVELLRATPVQNPDHSAAIQADTLSPMAKDLLPLMLKIAPGRDARAAAAMDRLKQWNLRMDDNEVGPLLFTAWLRELNRALFADDLGEVFEDWWDLRPLVVKGVLTEHPAWCDDRATSSAESCDDQLALSLDRALGFLAERYGDDMAKWSWGRAHVATFNHPILAQVPLLRDIANVAVPAPGGHDTVNRGSTPIRNPAEPFADIHGSGLRMIVDLADPWAARFMIVPGQSGNPFSPHYADLLKPWREFRWLSPSGGEGGKGDTLTLEPR
jgi:penicillin amidase